MNPPYNHTLGGKITEKALSKYKENIVCLMPLYSYKNGLYKNISSFSSIKKGFNIFKASISNNLCICSLSKKENKKEFMDFRLESFDQTYRDIYKYNIDNYKLSCTQKHAGGNFSNLNPDLDFIESQRCVTEQGGSGFSKNGSGYKWNYQTSDWKEFFPNDVIALIHFSFKEEKDNFCKWWYSDKKGKSLASKLLMGLGLQGFSKECYPAIPQIDWKNISNNELWKKQKYDEAVLDEIKTAQLSLSRSS